MYKCIYCLKTFTKSNFKSDEHVIPQCLGGKKFPKLINLVCKGCNNGVFSPLETEFKQDSIEGIICQMVGTGIWSETVWIKAKRTNFIIGNGIGIDNFNHAFPFIRFINNIPTYEFRSQLKVKNKSDGYQVFPIQYLKQLVEKNNKDFRKLKDERLKNISMNDMLLFTKTEDELDEAITLLKSYGIKYSEKYRKYSLVKVEEKGDTEISWEGKWDRTVFRVISKIAFNYFVFCSVKEGDYYKDLLYSPNFDKIRRYINAGVGKSEDFINQIMNKSILKQEDDNNRIVAHTIYFYIDPDGMIISRITLFGSYIYEIHIGKYPIMLLTRNIIGCGNMFDPFTGDVSPIIPTIHLKNKSSSKLYGLFQI